mgnify:CR=1 FL=1|jgi:putative FmdB family regulatory protein
MPTYQYQCSACEHEFEKYQSFSEDPILVCPSCNKKKVSKLISGGAGVVFKGGGFYETDYNRGKGSEYSKKVEAEKGKGSNAKESASDKKPKASPDKSTKAS